MPRVAALVEPYSVSRHELELVVALLSLVELDENQTVLRSRLEGLALAGAGRA
jgi:hypothetical protein